MKSFLIIGLGRFGSALAVELAQQGNEVVVCDRDRDQVNRLADMVTQAMVMDSMDEGMLKSIGVHNFDCVVVAFSNHLENNILLTMMLKTMAVKNLVVKARDTLHSSVLQKLGVDRIVQPEQEVGKRMAQILSNNNLMDFIEIVDGFSVAEIKVPKMWSGKSIRDANIRARYGLNVLAVKKEGCVFPSPTPDYVMQLSDILVVMGSDGEIDKVDKL